MRTALLLCGQMRTFDHPKVLEHTNRLSEKFNCDVFISTWKNRGVSMWSIRSQNPELYKDDVDDVITTSDIEKFVNVKDYVISDYDEYLDNLCSDEIKSLLHRWYNNKEYGLVASSSPEFYTMHLAAQMKRKYESDNSFTYDAVIRSRPDFLHLHTDIEEYFDDLENVCYHINTGKTYSPNRIYSMFLLGNSKTMDILCNCWEDYGKLAETNHSINYGKYDACRMMYAQCIENQIRIQSFHRVLGDCFRLENYSDYEFFKNWYS